MQLVHATHAWNVHCRVERICFFGDGIAGTHFSNACDTHWCTSSESLSRLRNISWNFAPAFLTTRIFPTRRLKPTGADLLLVCGIAPFL